jgi:hypothetical protein
MACVASLNNGLSVDSDQKARGDLHIVYRPTQPDAPLRSATIFLSSQSNIRDPAKFEALEEMYAELVLQLHQQSFNVKLLCSDTLLENRSHVNHHASIGAENFLPLITQL